MAVLEVMPQSWGVKYWFYCLGCRGGHTFHVRTDGKHPSWTFDGNMDRPTFSPSLLMPDIGCHLFVRAGRIEYCGDCRHDLAGKTVDMVDVDDPEQVDQARRLWEKG